MQDDKELEIKRYWQELYIQKEANPLDERTDKQFSVDINISYDMLTKWKERHRKQIYAQVNRLRGEYLAELRAKNLKEIAKNIKKNFNDRKLLAEITGDRVERVEQKTEIMGPKDQERRADALIKNIINKVKAREATDLSVGSEGGAKEDDRKPNGEQGGQPGTDSPSPREG